MNRKLIMFGLIFVFVFSCFVSADFYREEKSHRENYDVWIYEEGIHGNYFSLKHVWSSPRYEYETNESRAGGFGLRRYGNYDSYSGLNQAFSTFRNPRASYRTQRYGTGGYGYKRNGW